MAPVSAGRGMARAGLAPAAGALFVLAERVWPAGPARLPLALAGAALLAAALAWAAWLWWRAPAPGGERRLRAVGLAIALTLPAAAGVYYAGPALPAAQPGAPDWPAVFGWGWALLLLLGATAHGFYEVALLRQTPPLPPAAPRVVAAAGAGLTLGLTVALAVTTYFVAAHLPWQWDLAAFGSTRPAAETRRLAARLAEPAEVALFFPADNLVLATVRDYFTALSRDEAAAAWLRVRVHDVELAPAAARAFKARNNGVVVLRKGEALKPISLGLHPARAREALQRFDASFRQALVELTREKRKAYVTVGHGERFEQGAALRPEQRMTRLEELLAAQNFEVSRLGFAEGLGTQLPADAALVVVAGPTEPFLPAERAALQAYLERGGRLLLFLEPERGVLAGRSPSASLAPLLAAHGLTFEPVPLANARIFARQSFTAADHALLVTIGYQRHAIVSRLRRQPRQFPLLLHGAAAWRTGKAPDGSRVVPVVQAMADTFADANGNFVADPPAERGGRPDLVVAVEPSPPPKGQAGPQPSAPEGPRILAVADADLAADFLLQNRANLLTVTEGIAWLVGMPPGEMEPPAPADLRIRHVKGDEAVWFYLPVFGVPLLVLAVGLLLAVRRRRGGARHG